jgi:hypothetical protein
MTVWDVYNKLVEQRGVSRVILEAHARFPALSRDAVDALEREDAFITNLLEEIDVSHGRVTEADAADVF